MQNTKTVIIPGANHLTAVSNPAHTNSAILNFLTQPVIVSIS